MSAREFVKGNEALAWGALKAGLNAYFAYPITPSSEVPETLAREFRNPQYPDFKVFLQSSSELEAINMVIGAAATGAKVMTATSGPGFSLKQEGLSYAAGMELPFLVADINRAGPGLGNLGPEQSDYFQATKGGGHGGYRNIVLAPNSVQEMASFPGLAFSLAFKYRNPAIILADAFLGQLKEDIVFPPIAQEKFVTPWATTGARGETRHVLASLHLDLDDQSRHVEHLLSKYEEMDRVEQRAEQYLTDDAEVVIVAFGVVSRLCKQAVNALRARGVRAGLMRPITLSPFPSRSLADLASRGVKRFLVVELNIGQMVYDVKLAVEKGAAVEQIHRLGGLLPTSSEIVAKVEMTQA
ncbi:MAG TPA: 3-methyl-2-oxobutanoate dehydrogenase subunit VorB [Nitrososphaerales archaeon]|nr:3-methyl-2-oxobutanoate dehydrogenase subunit VorB [Nitrososphaerales archaeon]